MEDRTKPDFSGDNVLGNLPQEKLKPSIQIEFPKFMAQEKRS